MPDIQVTQAGEILVTTDSAAPIDVTQAGEILVTTDSAAPIDVTQAGQLLVSRIEADAEFTQMGRIIVTKLFIPGNNASCRVSVST